MVEIPNALAQSIRRGDCVLWTGAGLGELADRPAWKQILTTAATSLSEDEGKAVASLVDKGRLRAALDHLRRNHADALGEAVRGEAKADAKLSGALARLAVLPWASVFATVHPDLARRLAERGEKTPELLVPNELDGRSLDGRFVLHTPVDAAAWMSQPDLHDVVQQAHTILLLGFSALDPDLELVLEALGQLGAGRRHYAILSGLTAIERDAIAERFGVQVLDAGDALPEAIDALVEAGQAPGGADKDDGAPTRAALDLALVVSGLPLRADVATEAARRVDGEAVAQLVTTLGAAGLASVDTASLLRAGAVLLAHSRLDEARQCFSAASRPAGNVVHEALARFGGAWVSHAEGDAQEALRGLRDAGTLHSAARLVPAGSTLEAIGGRSGARVCMTVAHADGGRVDREVTTLPRALSAGEHEALAGVIAKLSALSCRAVAGIRGGVARGRQIAVERDAMLGETLAAGLTGGVLSLDDAARLIALLGEGLSEAHAQGLVHGCLTADDVVLTEEGPLIRGFGPAAVLRQATFGGATAPELLDGGAPTPKSDTFALANLAFRAVTGAHAAGGLPATRLVPDLDRRFDAAVAAGLHPEPAARCSVAELCEALLQIALTPDAQPAEQVAAPRAAVAPSDPDDLEGWSALLDKKPTHGEARAAIARIEQSSRAAGQWDRVADVLAIRAGLTQVVAERIALLRELAGVFEEKLGVPVNALETRRALIDAVAVGEQADALDDLARLAEVTGRWAPFAETLEAVAARQTDPKVQATLLGRLGAVQAEQLGAPERAMAAYEKAAELSPSAEAFGALVPMYRTSMRMAELATALLSLADHQEGADKVASLLAAAEVLQTDLGEIEGAFAALHAVLEADPDHADALAQAEDLARQLEDWDSLVDLLGRRADASVDGEQAIEQLREAAQVCLEHLEQPERAADLLGKLLDKDRSDRAAAEQRATILRASTALGPEQRVSLIDTVGILVDLVDAPEAKALLLAEQAALLDQEADGKERAADAREQVLAILALDRPEAQVAAAALEKWYRRIDDKAALARLLEQLGDSTDADQTYRVEAWTKLLQLRKAGPDQDGDGVVAVLEKLAELEPDSKEWRDDLLDRYLVREDFKKAGPLIREQVTDEEDPKRKAELLLRGGLLRGQIGKNEGAIEALEQAVALDDSLYEAWVALQELYLAREQPLKAIEAQVRGARGNPNRSERVRMTFEAAAKFLEDFGQPERGMALLEELVEFDPDHREATGMLVERLVASGDLSRAWPHAQTYVMQVRSQAANDRPLNIKALSIAGRCALAVGETDRARDYLEKARVFDATNLDVLHLLADLSMNAGEYTDALRHYQSVVLGVGSKMAPADLSRLYVRMADARKGMGEPAKAVQMAERALEIDPDNEGALAKLSELAETHGGAPALVKAKQRHADLLQRRCDAEDDPQSKAELVDQRVQVLRELAKLQSEELQAPIDAVRTLEALLEIKPDDPGVLHEILGMFTKSGRWRDATNVIRRLADAQSHPSHRAKYLWAGALIFRDHLNEPEHTMEWVKQVLDADPLHDKAYEGGLEILRKAGNFKEVARLMRGRLKALPKDAPAEQRVALFADLGEIYEQHLADPKTAIAAYNQSVRFATGELASTDAIRERRLKVMGLAVELGDDEIDKAILQGHALISDNPVEFEVYHRLVALYLRRGDRDRARALSRTLVFLKQGDAAEQELAAQTGGAGSTARRKISRELWRKAVMHRQQSGRISDIFATVWPMVAAREGHTHKKFGVSRSQRTEVSIQSPNAVARFLAHACQVIDAPQPDFFVHDEPGGLIVDALVDTEGEQQRVFTSVLSGKESQAEKGEVALKFMTGRAIARARPEHILGAMLQDAGSLRSTLYGVVAVSLPDAEIPTEVRTEAGRLAEVFRTYLPPSKIEQLGKVASKLVAQDDFDTQRWLESAAHTVTRAGFILCDDLQTAARLLTNEGDAGLAVPVKDRVRDLIAYSVSDPYLTLRREIGLAG